MPLSFGHPAFLLGLASIAVPIWLHLYYRKNPIRRDFPSLRLIRLAQQTILNRLKLRNYLLLALRILLLALLTLALARPFLQFGGGGTGTAGEPSAFVIVLDNSLSMGASHQGIALFNAAKSRAIEILDKMTAYDKASVMLMNDPGTLLFSQLTWDRNELKEAVRNAPLSAAGTSLLQALTPALKLLVPVRSFKRTVYVITDVTKSSWKPFLDAYDPARIDPEIQLVLVPIGETAPPNLAVTELTLSSPLVLKGRGVPIQATVANFGDVPQKTRLSLLINGDKKHDLPVELAPGERKRLTASCTFIAEGISHVRATLSGDSLPQDDSRHLAVKVLAPQKVLILRPPTDREGRDTPDDLYLRFALNPLDRRDGAAFLVDRRTPEEARTLNLLPYVAVFWVNGRRLPDELVKNLSSYVLAGGNVITFPGSRTDPDWCNTTLVDNLGAGALLPARLVKRVGNAVSRAVTYQLTDPDLGHPALRLFQAADNGDLSRARIFEFYQMEANPSALVLARLSHGLPAVVEETRGQGRIMVVAFAADLSWSDWPLKPTFLPFLHQAVLGMIGRSGATGETLFPGSPVRLTLREEGLQKVRLTHPDGKAEEIPIRREGPGLIQLSTTNTEQVGFYRLDIEWKDRTAVEGFAVNSPPDESDLERFPVTRIPRFVSLQARQGRRENFGEKVTMVREGREAALPLLWILLAAALVETILANRPPTRLSRS